MKFLPKLAMLVALVAVACCLDPDPPFTDEEEQCILRESEESREAIREDCNVEEDWSSLQNLTGQFEDINCDLSECVLDLVEVYNTCDRSDVADQINEECDGASKMHGISVVLMSLLAAGILMTY